MSGRPKVAVFRPDDERLESAVDTLDSLGLDALADPLLTVDPTDASPRNDADTIIFTSVTGVDLATGSGWSHRGETVCAIGESTADALRETGISVDVVPSEYSSTGLVEALSHRVGGQRVEVARSDHGSKVLLEGLEKAGAYTHETVLYRLQQPADAGAAVAAAAEGELDGVAFTSSLTVEHFLEIAAEQGRTAAAKSGLSSAIVGAIGEPTRKTAAGAGISVDVVPESADFEALAEAIAAALASGDS